MKAMILAAGYGTRLRPVTYTLPKPQVPLCNRPLVSWAIDRVLQAGVKEIIVNLHHLPEMLERYLDEAHGADVKIHVSVEPEILGTGGGVRKVRSILELGPEFYLLNGDTVGFPPLAALRSARHTTNAVAALTLRHPPPHDRFTPVYLDKHVITGFGSGRGEAVMFSGTHLISSRIFLYIPDRPVSGIIDDVYQPLISGGIESVAGLIDDGIWFDIGTPLRYFEASTTMLSHIGAGRVAAPIGSRFEDGSLLSESTLSSGALLSTVVGERSVVASEALLRDTIVWNDCQIGAGADLDHVIVAHGVRINRPLHARNAFICAADPRIPRDPSYHFDGNLVSVPIDPNKEMEI